MESWIRYRIPPGDAVIDAEPLDAEGGGQAPPIALAELLASEGLLRVELVAGRLRDHEADFLRVDSRAGGGLDVAAYAAAASTYVLVRPVQAHSSGLVRLAFVYSVLARSRDAVIYTDAAAAILGASERWLELYGLPPEEVLGRNPRIVNSRQAPRSYFRAIWRDLTDPRLGSWSGELVNRRESGEHLRVWQTITTLRDAQDAVSGYLGVTRDLTQYREVVERLEASNRELARRNRVQDEVLRGLARGAGAPAAPAPAPDRSALVVERLYLRSLARTESELLADLAERRGVRIRWRERGVSLPSLGDKARLSEAIGELLRRALDLAPVGGEIGVTLGQSADGTQEILVTTEGAALPARAAAGPELALAARVVELHGGTLAESRDGSGHLRLALRLPLDWSRFSARPWAAALFDPAEKLWGTVANRLREAGLPVFVAQRPEELRFLCRQELPNLLLLAEGATLPSDCRAFSPAEGASPLAPAICHLRIDPESGEISIDSAETGPEMAAEIAALFAGRQETSAPSPVAGGLLV